MFTISEINEAHSKVKSGSDFPDYIQDLIKIGVTRYDIYVSDGHAAYFGTDNFVAKSDGKYPVLTIADESETEKFLHYLKIHQQGKTDYQAFCNHSAECGIEKWTVNMIDLTCTYYDKQGTEVLTEAIPGKR